MKKIITLLLLFTTLLGCEKDDICAEATPTTPQLIIRFYDNGNQGDTKTVTLLKAYGLNEVNNEVEIQGLITSDKDSIVLPLNTNAEFTKFVLHRDYSIENDITLGNPDTITISYEREKIYVSRACGYKSIFNNLGHTLETDSDNWISSIIIEENTTVKNETSAHVKIFH